MPVALAKRHFSIEYVDEERWPICMGACSGGAYEALPDVDPQPHIIAWHSMTQIPKQVAHVAQVMWTHNRMVLMTYDWYSMVSHAQLNSEREGAQPRVIIE